MRSCVKFTQKNVDPGSCNEQTAHVKHVVKDMGTHEFIVKFGRNFCESTISQRQARIYFVLIHDEHSLRENFVIVQSKSR